MYLLCEGDKFHSIECSFNLKMRTRTQRQICANYVHKQGYSVGSFIMDELVNRRPMANIML